MQRRVVLAYATDTSCSKLDLAERFGVKLSTIDTHLKNVFTKLDVHSRLEGVEMLWKYGWK